MNMFYNYVQYSVVIMYSSCVVGGGATTLYSSCVPGV